MNRLDQHTIYSGYLPVGEGHEVFYEVWGNPSGRDVLFFHGGPGFGYTPADKKLFDPNKHRVIFHDQRGAGESRYKDPFRANNTSRLLADVEKLREHLRVSQAILVGGSWGATMALLTAMTNPHLTDSVVIRAFFPANKECIDLLADEANAGIVPKAYLNFISLVPRGHRNQILAFYAKYLRNGSPSMKEDLASAWQELAMALGRIEPGGAHPSDQILHAAITAHYAHHVCFLPDDYLYENAGRFAGIPIHIVHGNKDLLCPINFAERFAEVVPDVTLEEVNAGHSLQDKPLAEALRRAIRAATC